MSEFVDPYVDPVTGILHNLVGATMQDELDKAEADLTYVHAMQFVEHSVKVPGDLRQLSAIHGHLFQDVYEWAGKLRTIDIRKNTEAAGFFMPVSRLQQGAGFAFRELAEEKMLRGLLRDRFIDRLAHHYDQVNSGASH